MTICIIGWYGTETIGDRGILAGILFFLSETINEKINIKLGSIHPFFSERTVFEDSSFINEVTANKIDIEIFDSKSIKELEKNIIKSDLLVMGGGPLMDIDPVYMVLYAFDFAKKHQIKTAVLGCGIGPLKIDSYVKSVKNITEKSDVVIFRDEISLNNYYKLGGKKSDKISVSFDPAVYACMKYLEKNKRAFDDYIAINIRSFPQNYSKNGKQCQIDDSLLKFISDVSEKFSDNEIRLIPMHYFVRGNDDRFFMSQINRMNKANINIQQKPMTLEETFKVFKNAKFNIGMRFHSVVFQTILNGNNFILDYTGGNSGKTAGFINMVDKIGFYKNRFFDLQSLDDINIDEICLSKARFDIDPVELIDKLSIYQLRLKEIL